MTSRTAQVTRNTLETRIAVSVNLDGTGQAVFDTGVPFLEHMMDQIARHGLIDLDITCKGDTNIDDHHTVEDIGITLGQAMAKAVGDKKGIRRYGHAYVPMDESLARVALDFSGRPGLVMEIAFTQQRIGTLDAELVSESGHGSVDRAHVTLHIDSQRGATSHPQPEAVYKAFGRALRMALAEDPRMAGVMPS